MIAYTIYWLVDFLIVCFVILLIKLSGFVGEVDDLKDYLDSIDTSDNQTVSDNATPTGGGYHVNISYVQEKVPVEVLLST
jgi:hypothetical protein